MMARWWDDGGMVVRQWDDGRMIDTKGQQVLQDGACVPPALCRCHLPPTLAAAHNLSLALQLPPGTSLQHGCTRCVCVHGTFNCSQEECNEEPPTTCQRLTELRTIAKGPCALHDVEVSFCAGHCQSRTTVTAEVSGAGGGRGSAVGPGASRCTSRQEPYLQSVCECCSYRLDPAGPVRVLRLPCPGGQSEPVVLPIIHSCQCSPCQGEHP
ncbi:hypothetical protein AAES_68738 [Amazona aestiva]|uniref:CTCK domain-containing protein n=1 Tax=Amazona aestiva TaxID=12930 RepID=A0A0Q3PPG3_AMAAE|nr:hypothetical protein AAES_68738 [Amazona aestiva]